MSMQCNATHKLFKLHLNFTYLYLNKFLWCYVISTFIVCLACLVYQIRCILLQFLMKLFCIEGKPTRTILVSFMNVDSEDFARLYIEKLNFLYQPFMENPLVNF